MIPPVVSIASENIVQGGAVSPLIDDVSHVYLNDRYDATVIAEQPFIKREDVWN